MQTGPSRPPDLDRVRLAALLPRAIYLASVAAIASLENASLLLVWRPSDSANLTRRWNDLCHSVQKMIDSTLARIAANDLSTYDASGAAGTEIDTICSRALLVASSFVENETQLLSEQLDECGDDVVEQREPFELAQRASDHLFRHAEQDTWVQLVGDLVSDDDFNADDNIHHLVKVRRDVEIATLPDGSKVKRRPIAAKWPPRGDLSRIVVDALSPSQPSTSAEPPPSIVTVVPTFFLNRPEPCEWILRDNRPLAPNLSTFRPHSVDPLVVSVEFRPVPQTEEVAGKNRDLLRNAVQVFNTFRSSDAFGVASINSIFDPANALTEWRARPLHEALRFEESRFSLGNELYELTLAGLDGSSVADAEFVENDAPWWRDAASPDRTSASSSGGYGADTIYLIPMSTGEQAVRVQLVACQRDLHVGDLDAEELTLLTESADQGVTFSRIVTHRYFSTHRLNVGSPLEGTDGDDRDLLLTTQNRSNMPRTPCTLVAFACSRYEIACHRGADFRLTRVSASAQLYATWLTLSHPGPPLANPDLARMSTSGGNPGISISPGPGSRRAAVPRELESGSASSQHRSKDELDASVTTTRRWAPLPAATDRWQRLEQRAATAARLNEIRQRWEMLCAAVGLDRPSPHASGRSGGAPIIGPIALGPPTRFSVELRPGQLPSDFEALRSRLAVAYDVPDVAVRALAPGWITIELITRETRRDTHADRSGNPPDEAGPPAPWPKALPPSRRRGWRRHSGPAGNPRSYPGRSR